MHYDSRFGNYRNHIFSHELVNALALIGIFIIIVACVNFINLATAQAINRSKEVGVRKVLGSSRPQLIFQFLGETILLTTTAVIISITLAAIALPCLNSLLETRMTLNFACRPAGIIIYSNTYHSCFNTLWSLPGDYSIRF
jgi:ABC-type antimicrobial peptide transport system permease subunit